MEHLVYPELQVLLVPRETKEMLDEPETLVLLELRELMVLETPEPPVCPELREMLVPLEPPELVEPKETLECLVDP